MLHEILLSLAGHSSPLLTDDFTSSKQDADNGLQLSSSERQLLAGVATLSTHHRNLKRHLKSIVQDHPSIVCRAVANSLLQTHLRRFTAKILQVESSILRRDASTVGAYDIVPLAFVVGQFNEWQRPMSWFWELTTFILPEGGVSICTGASLIDRLRSDSQTGFPDIEKAAQELSAVAELAWLKQLATWVLHGTINDLGASDFFVQREELVEIGVTFRKHIHLMPSFVADSTARSVIFIGRSLNLVHTHRQANGTTLTAKLKDVMASHLSLLTDITLPITSAQLNQVIAQIRSSLSRNVLKDLLPLQTTSTALQCLQRYLLLSNTDFASCLINETEIWRDTRWRSMDRLAQQNPVKALQGLSLKDAETSQILKKTWKAMHASTYLEHDDDVFEFAKKNISLSVSRKPASRPSTADSAAEDRAKLAPVIFNDLLLAAPTALVMKITPPLDLLLTPFDIGLYSSMNAYLLTIRRAQLRLEDLWRRNTARRYKPRSHDKVHLRKGWATCSAVLVLLSELAAYLGSSVTRTACNHFQLWASSLDADGTQKDPKTISAGHRVFLDILIHALLLTDMAFLKELRALLGVVDQMSSLFTRWLDLHNNEVEGDHKVVQELDKVCQRAAYGRHSVINRLREVHQGRSEYIIRQDRDTGGYGPPRLGGLDHLLMKLEFEQLYVEASAQ